MSTAHAAHERDGALARYQGLSLVHENLGLAVSSLLRRILPSKVIVTTSYRIKEFDSFFAKANKIVDNKLKYKKPFEDITDVVGFRVIVIARRNVEQVCSAIRENLKVVEEENKSDELLEQGKLGYESHHLIVELGEARQALAEYQGLCGSKFEVQVRTALQHAWAENEHRVQYKITKKDPDLNKRFLRLTAAISSADEEFDRIYEINERLEAGVASVVSALEDTDKVSDVDVKVDKGAGKKAHEELRSAAQMFGVGVMELVRQRRFSEAIQVYDRFVSIQANQPSHFVGRARAKALCGDVDGALEDLEVAEILSPDHPGLKNVLSILDKLISRTDD